MKLSDCVNYQDIVSAMSEIKGNTVLQEKE